MAFSVNRSNGVAIALMKNNTALEINNVTMDMGENTLLLDKGVNGAKVHIIDSVISTNDYYCFSTNASDPTSGQDVVITIINSTLTASRTDGDTTAILFNIPGTMNIEGCNITADRQAVINRCGTLNIKNSTLTNTGVFNNPDKYTDTYWGSGNEVPMGVIVVGNYNKTANGAYNYDATLNLDNVTINTVTGIPQVYAAAYWGRTTTISNGGNWDQITADSDDDSIIMIK